MKVLKIIAGAFAVALLVPALLSGCDARFGNKTTTDYQGYDLVSGYYRTSPQSLDLKVTLADGTVRNQSAGLQSIPEFVGAVMGTPVMLYYDSPTTGEATLRSHEDPNNVGFSMNVSQDSTELSYSAAGSVWTGGGCVLHLDSARVGKIAQLPAAGTQGGFTVRGTISLAYQSGYTFQGADADCAVWRTALQNCYNDDSSCDNDATHGAVHELFDPFVSGGILSASEIHSARAVEYRVQYQ